jgi:pSer/pThr/pTyr-binding forkhead associated (FHA) protein
MPILKMLRGPDVGTEFPLQGETITIGRGRRNDIIIQDNEVSRTHCRLMRVLDDYEIHDLESTNGTFVNGQRITGTGWLLSGRSVVELGDSITLEYLPSEIEPVKTGGATKMLRAIAEIPYYLVIEQRSTPQPDIYLLDRLEISMGREVDNDIVLLEPEVSRHHLRLILTEDGYAIEDLNTMNGTHLNDKRLTQERALRQGDVIKIGENLRMWYTGSPNQVISRIKSGKIPGLGAQENTRPSSPHLDTADMERQTDMIPMVEVPDIPSLVVNALEGHVYIIYARSDWTRVTKELYKYLYSHGIPIWVDQQLEPNTYAWNTGFEQALHECQCLLVVLSQKSVNEAHVQRGIRRFLARSKPIVLLRVGEVANPPAIQNMPAVQYDPEDPGRAYRLLLAELRKLDYPEK